MKFFRTAVKYGSKVPAKAAGVGLAGLFAAISAHAQAVTIDTAGLVSRLSSGEATMTEIGLLGLSLLALVALFKYIRRVF